MVRDDTLAWVSEHAAALLEEAAAAHEVAGDPELAERHRQRAHRLRSRIEPI